MQWTRGVDRADARFGSDIPIAVLPDGRASFENLHALLERKLRSMPDALLPPNATEADRNELFEATIGPA